MQGTAAGEPGRTLPRIMWVLASMLAMSVAVASPAAATSGHLRATSSPAVSHVSLRPRQVYTSTGITLRLGDSVTISASGTMRFGGGKIATLTPPGILRGPKCDAIARGEPRANPWPAPEASCWSLIAKVGEGAPLEVGASTSFRAANAGVLLLGLNDNFVIDNSGSWRTTISVTRAPTTPTTPASSTSTKKSSTLIFVLIGVAVLALVLLLAGWRQRTSRRRAKSQVSADPALAAASLPLLAESNPDPPVAPPPESAPPETDSIDVNIFDVEFSNGLTLRIGYNHFPEGTELKWRVTQNRVPAAAGSFVAKGGGSTNHVETVPLGVKLEGRESQADGADVQFDWSINGVPFRYSVRRDTNC